MFEGKLPQIPRLLSDAKTFLGKCTYRKQVNSRTGKTEYVDFKLRINCRADLPEREIEDTIIHEMIHYYIHYHQLEDTSSHGQLFRQIMNGINTRFGRNLSVSFKGTKEQNEQLTDKRQHYHVVAVVSLVGGTTGIKVLPRIVQRILYYYNQVLANKMVTGIQLYMSNNVFFNRYPNSTVLKVHYIDKDEVMRQLEGAEKMECDGKTIRRPNR